MFGKIQEAKYNDYRFHASLQGIDLDKQISKVADKIDRKVEGNILAFRDPEEYEQMTPEEREQLTHKMMEGHKKWMNEKTKEDLGKG